MTEMNTAFLVWNIVSSCFLLFGIYCFFAKKPVGFWANDSRPLKVNHLKDYNHACGKLWIGFSFGLILLSIPFLFGNIAIILLATVIGSFIDIITLMIIYSRIENKYRINK